MRAKHGRAAIPRLARFTRRSEALVQPQLLFEQWSHCIYELPPAIVAVPSCKWPAGIGMHDQMPPIVVREAGTKGPKAGRQTLTLAEWDIGGSVAMDAGKMLVQLFTKPACEAPSACKRRAFENITVQMNSDHIAFLAGVLGLTVLLRDGQKRRARACRAVPALLLGGPRLPTPCLKDHCGWYHRAARNPCQSGALNRRGRTSAGFSVLRSRPQPTSR
jgi:hypothetical protein